MIVKTSPVYRNETYNSFSKTLRDSVIRTPTRVQKHNVLSQAHAQHVFLSSHLTVNGTWYTGLFYFWWACFFRTEPVILYSELT